MSNTRKVAPRDAVRLRPLSMDRLAALRDRRIGECDDRRARQCRAAATKVAEWGAMAFYYDGSAGVLVRDGNDGTHAWQYATVADLDHDWAEIETVARTLARSGEAELWEGAEHAD